MIAYRFSASVLTLLILLVPLLPAVTRAQGNLSITVTPPLVQVGMAPGDAWSSTLKIVNSNNREVTYYAEVVNFIAFGEEGQSEFVPILPGDSEHNTEYALAQWIALGKTSVVVPPGASGDIPYTIRVPDNAPPGGHYAAILVGTRPGGLNAAEGASVSISSLVSSLMFVRVAGDIVEDGAIREFSTKKSLYQEPKAEFVLRFQNDGNTHLRPKGLITIYNMWGKERGQITVNENQHYGNVLPESIRKFEFSWEGERSFFDIGPYHAQVTLTYGEESRYNISAKTYFWIVPFVPVSIALGSLVAFILLLTWFIRRYIRRALELEKIRAGMIVSPLHGSTPSAQPLSLPQPMLRTLVEPLREGVIDMRSLAKRPAISDVQAYAPSAPVEELSAGTFISKYRLFFLFIIVVIAGGIGLYWYFTQVLQGSRPFEGKQLTPQEELRVIEE